MGGRRNRAGAIETAAHQVRKTDIDLLALQLFELRLLRVREDRYGLIEGVFADRLYFWEIGSTRSPPPVTVCGLSWRCPRQSP